MNQDSEKKKSSEILANLAQGAVSFSKKVADGARSGVTAIVEKAKADELARRLKKYNPLFPEQYQAASFTRPNIIVIVDDAVRKGIDVCEGAIGWLGKENGSEVLYLYDEAITFSGVQFIPAATCDAVYYVDNFDRNRFIRTDAIFGKALEEKMAELEHIAYCIGAKRCTIDICETTSDNKSKSQTAEMNASKGGTKAAAKVSAEITQKSGKKQEGHNEIVFGGFRRTKQPTLKWFAYDEGMKSLIDMCCNGGRKIKTKTLRISGSTTATMSQKIAGTLDSIMSDGSKSGQGASMSAKAKEEHSSVLEFHVEF